MYFASRVCALDVCDGHKKAAHPRRNYNRHTFVGEAGYGRAGAPRLAGLRYRVKPEKYNYLDTTTTPNRYRLKYVISC